MDSDINTDEMLGVASGKLNIEKNIPSERKKRGACLPGRTLGGRATSGGSF